jgi:hypothetical protein
MRVISGIMGITLMQEKKVDEAKKLLQPLTEWAAAESQLPQRLNPQNIMEIRDSDKFRTALNLVTEVLTKGQGCTEHELEQAKNQLVKVLNELK